MWKQYRTLPNTTTALAVPGQSPPADFVSAYRRTPYRKMELIADVAVPLAQATITGLLTTFGISVIGLFNAWPWYIGPICGVFVTGGAWLLLLWYGRESLWVTEEIIHDIDDGETDDDPPPQTWEVRAEVSEGKRRQFADLPGEPAQLHNLGTAVINGESFSERTATNAGFTQENWGLLRDQFITRGWAHWNHPTRRQNGVTLLRTGRAILQKIAATPLPPAPDEINA